MRIFARLRKTKTVYMFKQGKVILPALLLLTVAILIFSPDEDSISTTESEETTVDTNVEAELPLTTNSYCSTPKETEEVSEVEPLFEYPETYSYDLMMYTTTSVHLRSNPDKSSNSIAILSPCQIVIAHIENINDDWYFVSWDDTNGSAGWIKSEYLKEYNHDLYIDIPLEYQYQDLVRELITLFDLDIDEYFIYGMMYTENRFNNEEESEAGAQGILQIIPFTWNLLYKDFCREYPELACTIENDATDKRSNITLGIYYIKQIRDSYNCQSVSENASRILTTYNRGPGGAEAYYNAHGTYSTSYSQEILRAAEYIRVNKTWKEGL